MNICSVYVAGKDSIVFYTAICFVLYSAHVTLLITSAFRIYDTLTVYDASTVYGASIVHITSTVSGTTHVDLVSAHAPPGKSRECSGNFSKSSRYLCSCFFLFQLRRSRKQSHTFHASTVFHLIWITDRLTQHLISATDSKNNGILRFLFDQRLQTIFPHPFQIGHCIFAARKHDHVRVV